MQEGGGAPEQSRGPSRINLKARLARFIPGRFKHPEQLAGLAEPPIEISVLTPSVGENPITPPQGLNDLPDADLVLEESVDIPQVENPISPPVEDVLDLPSRTTGIATMFTEKLRKKGLVTPEVVTTGVSAILGTNETVGGEFLDAVQARNPEGYLVGVGAGNALTMLHCFQDTVTPKGVILADIDPGVIAVGKLLIRNLKKTQSAKHLEREFFDMPENDFYASIQNLISSEEDPVLKEKWQNMNRDAWKKYWGEFSHENPSYRGKEYGKIYRDEHTNLSVTGAILDKFATLKQLAMEDNIAIAYADFTDPAFIDTVRELPDFQESSNIIYFSNIADHITVRGRLMENIGVVENLRAYEHAAKPAVFVDTLGYGLNYCLRARQSVPTFTHDDFKYRESWEGKKPEGLLFADAA